MADVVFWFCVGLLVVCGFVLIFVVGGALIMDALDRRR